MSTSANISFFAEGETRVRVATLNDGSRNTITLSELGNPTALYLFLSDEHLGELHRKIGEHLHAKSEQARAGRLAASNHHDQQERADEEQAARWAYDGPSYLYRLRYRPVCKEHLPEGLVWHWVERPSCSVGEGLPISRFRYGVFASRELTSAEMEDFQVSGPLDIRS